MTDSDIAVLLADAADAVEIGTAPTQAVLRGGRRRRARRWAVATAAAVVIVGASGTVALAGLGGGDGAPVGPVATQEPPPAPRHLTEAQATSIAAGTYRGKAWDVYVEVWDAPRDKAEARLQFAAMAQEGLWPDSGHASSGPSDLVGNTSYFVRTTYGGGPPRTVASDTLPRLYRPKGAELSSTAASLTGAAQDAGTLVVGQVAKTTDEVTCHWKKGPSTVLLRGSGDFNSDGSSPGEAQWIMPVAGMPADWFACVAPQGGPSTGVQVTG